MRFLTNAFACGLLSFASSIAAQSYPSKPITLIVPFAAGGPTDTLARILAEPVKQSIGQPILVEDVTGAGGTIGLARAARAAPDGYTVILGNWTSHVGGPALYPIQQDVLKDFEPVARLPVSRLWVTGKTGLPAKDAAELVAWLKANPTGHVRHRRRGQRGAHLRHLPAEFHRHAVSIRALPRRRAGIPGPDRGKYRSHLHGRLRRALLPPLGTDQGLRRRRERPLDARARRPDAGRSRRRRHGPHVLERRCGRRRARSREIVAKLNLAVADAFTDPKMQQRMADLGMEILPREQQTPEALGAYHKAETEKWWPIIKAAGIKLE